MSTQRLQQLQALLSESPRDSFLLFAIAKELEKLDRPDEALQQYRLLLETDAHYVGAYYHLAKLLEKKDQRMEALAIYEKGMLVARQAGDQHALGELATAKLLLEEE
ncbi:MAG TPA: hypothetical protein PKA00_18440 [Saprospiraceae bacterium]|nr:hypothetical protein [Saprospiraceae bacterium]HMQ84898.1 hypothetical protein [Saprospiraceae bacterium]